MNPEEKVIIFIDGGNTYSALFKEKTNSKGAIISALLPKGTKFNYKKFAEYISNGRKIMSIKYYVGIVRNTDNSVKSQKMVASQQKFNQSLINMGIEVERGRIVYDHGIREKGVDVKIAIDLVINSIEEKYDTAIIISSDSDLIPAIKYVRGKNKKVEYIGFNKHYSTALINESSSQRVFDTPDLVTFIDK